MAALLQDMTGQCATLLKRAELAKSLSCSIRQIDKLQNQGMPCVFLTPTARRFVLTEVIAWLKRRGGAR